MLPLSPEYACANANALSVLDAVISPLCPLAFIIANLVCSAISSLSDSPFIWIITFPSPSKSPVSVLPSPALVVSNVYVFVVPAEETKIKSFSS